MNLIMTKLNNIISLAEEMRNAYFWSSPGNAASRRWYERNHSVDKIEWDEGGHHYTAEYDTTCSCHHIYASGYYTRDGKKTTLTAIRNSYKRMEAADEQNP